jgi:hypothetical protein
MKQAQEAANDNFHFLLRLRKSVIAVRVAMAYPQARIARIVPSHNRGGWDVVLEHVFGTRIGS